MWYGAGSVLGQLRRLSVLHCTSVVASTQAINYHSTALIITASQRLSVRPVSYRLPVLPSSCSPSCRLSHSLSALASTSADPTVAALSVDERPLSAVCPSSPPSFSSPPLTDRILLAGLLFHGRHGVYPAERELGQKFVVDASLSLPLTRAALTGQLTDSVDYGAVYRCIRRVVEVEQYGLLEELAWHCIAAVMADWPGVERMSVRVKKPHVAVEGAVEYLGVEMERSRAQWQAEVSRVRQRKRRKDITQLQVE